MIEGCEKNCYGKGYCQTHYMRLRRTGDPLKAKAKLCSIEGCEDKHYAKGYCNKHFQRYKKSGDPLKTQKIYGQNRENHPLYQAHRDIIARCNNPKSKAYKHYGGRGIKVCQRWSDQITGLQNFAEDIGEKPTPKHSIDRIDNEGNYSCGHCEQCVELGWEANCRWATWTQQLCNQRARPNPTGYTGVHKNRNGIGYYCVIRLEGKQTYLGAFKTAEQASLVYQKAKLERDKSL